MFKSAYWKLTLSYVLIAMAISIAFSVAIFNISSTEIGKGLGRQARVLRDTPMNDFESMMTTIPDLETLRNAQIDESNNRLKTNLFYYNLLILVLASGASYFLARKTLEPIKDMLEEQNRFTADASHELRTPLTALRTEIEVNLLDKDLDLNQSKKLLQSNLEEIEKLEVLSAALLKLAKYQDQKKNRMARISLEEVVVEAYEKVESLANKKSIVFENQLADIKVAGDNKSLVELFVILIDNAVKYSPKDSKINIRMSEVGSTAVIRVKDSGVGIKSSDLPYIFNRFYRADTSRNKEQVDGYGLGLSIAKQITDLHKGTIHANSKIGQGSEFVVKLPIYK